MTQIGGFKLLLDGYHEDMDHMMSWFGQNYFLIIGGFVVFILIVVVLLYMLSRSTNRNEMLTKSNHANEEISTINETVEIQGTFCPKCGTKLEEQNMNYCPSCGSKI
ncbi:MAG: zinc ribbon domain-containing protein [Promethearchaeota archaeon]